MTARRYPFDPPIDPDISCRHCGNPLLATARIVDGIQVSGLNQYEWTHTHGSDTCRPTTVAQPFDGWRATTAVQAAEAERAAAEDARIDALEATL